MENDDVKKFLIRANKSGYGNEYTQETAELDGSHTITYSEKDWSFHDNYFGGEPFGGREVIHHKGRPVWMMVYYGGVTDSGEAALEIYAIL
jgi:hypothetical protein